MDLVRSTIASGAGMMTRNPALLSAPSPQCIYIVAGSSAYRRAHKRACNRKYHATACGYS
jgi:hypothetical protein